MIETLRRTGCAALLGLMAMALLATGEGQAQTAAPQPAPGTTVYPAQPGTGDYEVVSPGPPTQQPATYGAGELIDVGHEFFGEVSQGLASVVEHAIGNYGLPNGYVVGQEATGAFVGGARYGEGILYTKNAGQHRVYWQGPSIGLDVGANGNRVMMLIYNLPAVESIYQRYVGVNGSAYIVAGLGMTVLSRRGVYVVPIVSGVGARLGVNFGYLKFTDRPTWNPF
ncbi:DUF1134 domain-containing protein [Bauldia litoralis]|uniref:DUF1134 domain-containing protein n=1 Tax=Bauldia litoralis TaxID=665467 RepID=A0A1G6A0Y1_9HYPH|nr:DUF1134 domain-containing protein [Bauldia litoralis]SDB02075.1 hypothetical protein SAMN02982931_00022 [Bauldia litoralis]